MREKHADRTLVLIVATLVVTGIFFFLSASLTLLTKGEGVFAGAILSQVVLGLGGGLVLLAIMLHIPLTYFKKYALHFFIFSIFLSLLVFAPFIGLTVNGASRWIDLSVITFQPSELLKIGYILYLASFLSFGRERAANLRHGVVPFFIVTILVGALLLLQPDTDTFIVMLVSGCAMMIAAGVRVKHMAIFLGTVILALVFLVALRPYLLERVTTYMDPSRDPLGAGYHINQSLIAIGSGQITGRGFGQSIQKFDYLPEATSDAIFGVIGEEFGFAGTLSIVLLFLAFALRGMWIAARSVDLFGSLVVLGIVTLLVSQAFLNITAMTGLIPVGGLPLPFMSHGGSALLVALGMVGILLGISRTIRT